MSKNQIKSWNDFLFENRNKAYGAYQLRTSEPLNLLKSLLVVVFMVGVAVLVLSFTHSNEADTIETDPKPTVVQPRKIKDPVTKDEPPIAKKKEKVVQTTRKKLDSKVIPNAVDNPEVENPLTKNDLLGMTEDPNSNDAVDNGGIRVGNTNDDDRTGTTGQGEGNEIETNTKVIYNEREVARIPVFPGCEKAGNSKEDLAACMSAALQRELNTQLGDFGEIAHRENITSAKAKLQFIIDKSGKIVQINAVKGGNTELSKEAKDALERISNRLVQKGKFIKPASLSDGTVVNMVFSIPVQFHLIQ